MFVFDCQKGSAQPAPHIPPPTPNPRTLTRALTVKSRRNGGIFVSAAEVAANKQLTSLIEELLRPDPRKQYSTISCLSNFWTTEILWHQKRGQQKVVWVPEGRGTFYYGIELKNNENKVYRSDYSSTTWKYFSLFSNASLIPTSFPQCKKNKLGLGTTYIERSKIYASHSSLVPRYWHHTSSPIAFNCPLGEQRVYYSIL